MVEHMAFVRLFTLIFTLALTALDACKIHSTDLNECLEREIKENLKLLNIPYSTKVIPNFEFTVWNYNATGFGNFDKINVNADIENNVIQVDGRMPYIEGLGLYEMKGTVFDMDVTSSGYIRLYAKNVILKYTQRIEIVEGNGIASLKRDLLELSLSKDGLFYINFDNWDTGYLEKTVTMNNALNKYSTEVFALLVPIVEDKFTEIFNKIIDDIELTP